MASSVGILMERGVAMKLAEVEFNTTESQNATLALFNQLVFEKAKSVRTSTIILASFNALAAFATAASILYDCYWASKRCNPKFKASKFCISSIHPAETFPLILAIGIFVQSLIFAAVQGFGMASRTTTGCDVIAQVMFPALFIVPLIQVVFGIECAIRSLRKVPFQERGKYDVTICGSVILLLLIGAWIPTFIFKQPSKCFASLVWFISRYGTLGFVLLTTISSLMLISTITIFIRLSTVTMIDQHQRIAASRMVYYMVPGIVSLALVIPYFVTQIRNPNNTHDLRFSMIATVVLVLPGLMHGLLQLFLRSNTQTTSFSPKNNRHLKIGDRHEIRMWGPNELVFGNHLQDPVFGPSSPSGPFTKRSESRSSLIGPEKSSMDSLRPAFASPTKTPPLFLSMEQATELPTIPEPTKETPERHARKQSYSLFPAEGTKSLCRPNDNAGSVYDITSLAPPSFPFGKGHKRDSSIASSATVQIGLRLSHAPDVAQDSPETAALLALPSTSYNPNTPRRMFTKPALSPVPSPNIPQSTFSSALRINATATKSSTSEPLTLSPFRMQPPSLVTTMTTRPLLLSPQSINSSINKDLPPTPKVELAAGIEPLRISTTQLSPTVYSPSNENKSWVVTSPSKGKNSPKVAPPQQRRDWI